MAEIVNLKRAKKAKARTEKERAAEANRSRHGTPKAIRDLAKVREEKAAHDLDVRRLDCDKDGK